MPRKKPRRKAKKDLTPEEREKYFIQLYVKQGAAAEKISYCERRAGLKPGEAQVILARPETQLEIQTKMEPVRLVQMGQAVTKAAVDVAKLQMQEELAKQVEYIKLHKLDFDVLTGKLMEMVLTLSPHMHAKEIHEIVKTCLVIHGSLQAGNTKRVLPPENPSENPAANVYTSLFSRLRSNLGHSENVASEASNAQEEGIYDLLPPAPGQKPAPSLESTRLPPSGESIDEPPPKPASSNSDVIVVEVG